ncbi:hypothetical protein ACMD2_25321 [Ananas comosus]|uniref:UBA domain-containing protein n=1 Tax=Ananas comosus TaxID=4615 RepID=A0A199V9R5_ANACO|nr:hypothetical protein ACMD2_25321 [Ananas comosus]
MYAMKSDSPNKLLYWAKDHLRAHPEHKERLQGRIPLGADFEAKVQKLVELGFDRNSVIQALKLFNGNEDQAAGFLFG